MDQSEKNNLNEEEVRTPLADDVRQEQTATAGEQSTAEQSGEREPSKREQFLALNKKRLKVSDFTDRSIVDIKYSAEEGLGLIVKHLQEDYFHLDEDFLLLAEKKQSFTVTRLFAPVYRGCGVANYYWKKGSGKNATEHTSEVKTEAIASAAPAFLKAEEIGAQAICPTGMVVEEERLVAPKKPVVKECVKLLKEKADGAKPQKKADCIVTQEDYELIYVPVMKAELEYGGKVYTHWVNLVNGVCKVEYAVSPAVHAAADKTMEKLARRKRSIFSCFLYALTFVILNVLQWQLGEETPAADGGMEGLLLTIILGGVALGALLVWAACFGYKKNKMVSRAVAKGKMPSAKGAVLWNLLAALLAIASVVLFTVFVLI